MRPVENRRPGRSGREDDARMAQTRDLRELVRASATGDEDAWIELVRRLAPVVVRVTRQYRLSPADAQDVCQTVWLRLVEHLADIREPAALAGWLVTTAKHECQQSLRTAGRMIPVDPLAGAKLDNPNTVDHDHNLIEAERLQALREAVTELPPHQRALLELLAADPPLPYIEISRRLGISVGSIGPTRGRILQRLRETPAIQTYLNNTRAVSRAGR
jgi:RNA polymerase sigma factor (sigma-70 family)